jgi:squalene synthase HpnC
MFEAIQPVDFLDCHGTTPSPCPLEEARRYNATLARHHYENFQVVSLLLPRRLHQDFFNVYAYCRWADDLGDEMGDRDRSLELLGWWRTELEAMYAGETSHPVYIALADTVRRHSIPIEPFNDLITAFVQDQTITRYDTHDQVIEYCRYSANPVGRLVLMLGGYGDEYLFELSDATCTALQLANHWQDVRRDWDKDRVYIPKDVMETHGYSHEALAADIERGEASIGYRATVCNLVRRAEQYFVQGLPLVDKLDRRLAIDVELFSRGGMAVLDKIRALDYDTISSRPKVSKTDRLMLLLRVAARRYFRPAPAPPPSRNA